MTTTINADNGVVSGSAGLKYSSDSSGVLALQTNGTTAVTVDASQNVGIGSTPTAIGSYKVLEVNGTSGAYIALKQGGTEYGNIYNNSTDGTTISASGARNIIFQTNAAERMRIDSSGNFQFNSGYGSVATAFGCRAWVNFNGTGTVAIRASGNVSSITDNGTGDYTVNFTTAMADANYAVCGSAFGNVVHLIMSPSGTYSTTAVQVITSNTVAVGDNSVIGVAIFR